jgi:hypothetical protein
MHTTRVPYQLTVSRRRIQKKQKLVKPECALSYDFLLQIA